MKKLKDSVWLRKGPPKLTVEGMSVPKVQGKWPFHDGFTVRPKDPAFLSGHGPLRTDNWILKPLVIFIPEYIYRSIFPDGVLPCPNSSCRRYRSSEDVASEGLNPYGPRPVYGYDDLYYVIAKRYRCKACNTSFNGYDSRLLDILPRDIAAKFPALITQRAALDLSVLRDCRHISTDSPGGGFGFSQRMIASRYLFKYMTARRDWLSHVHRQKEAFLRPGSSMPVYGINFLQKDLPLSFPEFDDPYGYGSHIPSAAYLESAVLVDLKSRQPFIQRHQQMVDGEIWKADACLKLAKVIRSQSQTVFSSLYTVMNEYRQILGQWFLETGLFEELKGGLEGLLTRYKSHGFRLPQVVYSDNCCFEREEIWLKLLASDLNLPQSEKKLLPLKTLADFQPQEVSGLLLHQVEMSAEQEVDGIMVILEKSYSGGGQENTLPVIGFDCEWIYRDGKRGKVSLIQIAVKDHDDGRYKLSLFHLASIGAFPPSLKALLEDPNVLKVGCGIKGDATRICQDYGVQMQGVTELGDLTFDKGMTATRRVSLSSLVELTLGFTIPKPHTVRMSAWDNKHLTDEQQDYAALDALMGLKCFESVRAIHTIQDMRAPRRSELLPGTRVLLLDKSQKVVAAEGLVCESIAGADCQIGGWIGRVPKKCGVLVTLTEVYVSSVICPVKSNKKDSLPLAKCKKGNEIPWTASCLRLLVEGSLGSQVAAAAQKSNCLTGSGGRDLARLSREWDESIDADFIRLSPHLVRPHRSSESSANANTKKANEEKNDGTNCALAWLNLLVRKWLNCSCY